MRVLGIDPGSETLGWGVVDGSGSKYALVDFGTVKSNPKQQFSKRLLNIYNGVAEILDKHSPDVLSVEDTFYAVNVGVALKLGQVRGTMLLLAEQHGHRDRRICPAARKTNGRRIRQRGKTSGSGNGQAPVENENRTDAARRGRRTGDRDLPFSSRWIAGQVKKKPAEVVYRPQGIS